MMYFLTFDMFFHRLQEPEHKKIGQSPNLIRRKKIAGIIPLVAAWMPHSTHNNLDQHLMRERSFFISRNIEKRFLYTQSSILPHNCRIDTGKKSKTTAGR